jgi:hypothetical protein
VPFRGFLGNGEGLRQGDAPIWSGTTDASPADRDPTPSHMPRANGARRASEVIVGHRPHPRIFKLVDPARARRLVRFRAASAIRCSTWESGSLAGLLLSMAKFGAPLVANKMSPTLGFFCVGFLA